MSHTSPVVRRYQYRLAALALAMPLFAGGCVSGVVNMMALPFFLMGGDVRQPPSGVALVTSKKENKKVVVLSYADFGLRNGHGPLDDDLAGMLATEIAKAEERLTVVPERKVRQWRDQNPNWVDLTLQEIGEQFEVDYVIFFEVAKFSISDPRNPYLYQGNTKISFRVHDVNKDELVFQTDSYERDFPPNRPVPVTEVSSEDQFRQLFLRRIAQELSWYVVPHEEVNPIASF